MAGGKEKKEKAVKRKKLEAGSSSRAGGSSQPGGSTPAPPPVVPVYTSAELSRLPPDKARTFQNDASNRQFFRNSVAWDVYNTKARYKPLSQVYYYQFPEDQSLHHWERDRIHQMLDLWKWRSLIEFNHEFNVGFVKLLYANMVETTDPWGVRTYYAGKEISITIPVLATLLGIELNDNDVEVYPVRKWPLIHVGTETDYRQWLCLHCMDPPTSRSLPFFYQLGNAFINNILMPKADIKTNLEMNSVYFLRHLICGDQQINVPYVILSHMRQAIPSKPSTSSFPYAHLLMQIVKQSNLPIPKPSRQPINLFDCFPQLGWEKHPENLNQWIPNPRCQNNRWIKQAGAEPNQFIHPDEPPAPEQPEQPAQQTQHPAYQHPTYDPSQFGSTSGSEQFRYPGSWSQPPPGQCQNAYVGYIVDQVANLSNGMMHLMTNQSRIIENQARNEANQLQTAQILQNLSTRVETIENYQRDWRLSWLHQGHPWITPNDNLDDPMQEGVAGAGGPNPNVNEEDLHDEEEANRILDEFV